MRTLPDFDLSDPNLYAAGDPHAVWAWLREHAPVYRHRQRTGPGYWVITKHEDVRAISRDTRRFISSGGTSTMDLEHGDTASPEYQMFQGTLVITDPPRHTKLRALLNKAFTPQAVARVEPVIADVLGRLIGEAAQEREFDFVGDIASRLPYDVICELVGIPRQDRRALFDAIVPIIGSHVGHEPDEEGGPMQAALALVDYLREQIEARRVGPREDLISGLVLAEVDGERLGMFDMLAMVILLFVAGVETTINAISGGLQAFFDHPEQRMRVVTDPSLWPIAVEEILRWVSPTMVSMVRTATTDVELRGQRIAAGDKVTLWYGAANRDADVFPDPQVFDVGRSPNDHLAFGHGAHFCLGASLARLEIRTTLEAILRTLPGLEPAGEPERLRSNILAGYERMPVRANRPRTA
ncbi:MAG TPA: cytochrome P450 [Actinomycetota bacterium]|nr:cytochrome P450 [Actinomycetota bacterium]